MEKTYYVLQDKNGEFVSKTDVPEAEVETSAYAFTLSVLNARLFNQPFGDTIDQVRNTLENEFGIETTVMVFEYKVYQY